MARVVNIHAAKTQLSRLVDLAAEGEEIVIARAGRPVARLVALETPKTERKPGLLRGKIRLRADFDAPLPLELMEAFYRGGMAPHDDA
jgi:prevent-host-death family protein